jgi:hypothetical protein
MLKMQLDEKDETQSFIFFPRKTFLSASAAADSVKVFSSERKNLADQCSLTFPSLQDLPNRIWGRCYKVANSLYM